MREWFAEEVKDMKRERRHVQVYIVNQSTGELQPTVVEKLATFVREYKDPLALTPDMETALRELIDNVTD